MPDRTRRFEALSAAASRCRLCPALADLPAVLGPRNGSLHADLMFVAEAPGRFGAGRTGIPFQGDRSGENFALLLAHAGLTRDDVFITNAVLCNPLLNGNNRRPKTKEILNCSSFLRELLSIVSPRMVVTLGGVGLEAMNRLLGTRYRLAETVARPLSVGDLTLFPLYHPSPRVACGRRPLRQQKRDFKTLTRTLAALAP